MIKILIGREGNSDCGKVDYETGKLVEGPVEIYIRKILGEEKDIEFTVFDPKDKKNRPKLQRSVKSLRGHKMKALLLMNRAMELKCRCAAYYSDADREQGSDARTLADIRARYEKLKRDIFDGFAEVYPKHKAIGRIPGVAIIPVKMIESWLMGDPKAFPRAFPDGKKGRHKEKCSNQPELDWGDSKVDTSNHPKCRLKRILDGYDRTPNQTTFCEIARCADVEVLCENCPISFADFYEQLKAIV